MFKKIILTLVVFAVIGSTGFYFGQKIGFNNGMKQAALNISATKMLEAKKVAIQKPSGPNTSSMIRVIAGKWQVVGDTNYVREFTASSTFTDYRNNKKTQSGIISIFSAAKPDPEAAFTLDNGAAYLKIKTTNTEYPDFFRLDKITAAELVLTVVEGGALTSSNIILKRVK